MIKDDLFNQGSHLVTQRHFYTHHGLYLGNGFVIEYDRQKGVVINDLDSFCEGFNLSLIEHKNSPYKSFEIIQRALTRVGESNYNLLFNNCEHFVNWCIEGTALSYQVQDAYEKIGSLFKGYIDSKHIIKGTSKATILDLLIKTISKSTDKACASYFYNRVQKHKDNKGCEFKFLYKDLNKEKTTFIKKAKDLKDVGSSFAKNLSSVPKRAKNKAIEVFDSVNKESLKSAKDKVEIKAKDGFKIVLDSAKDSLLNNKVATYTDAKLSNITDNKYLKNTIKTSVSLGSMGALALGSSAFCGAGVATLGALTGVYVSKTCVSLASATVFPYVYTKVLEKRAYKKEMQDKKAEKI